MKLRLLAFGIGSGLLFGAVAADRQSDDMRRAIAWERYKDVAAARQAAKERKHPSVAYGNANRSADRDAVDGRTVKDPGPPAYRKDKQDQ